MSQIEEMLQKQGVFVGKTNGDSMEPMLRQGRDTVVIEKPVFPLKRYDVPVYRRDGHYTMHRIVWVRKKGYIICGDNRVRLEFDVQDSNIVGVLTGFYHDGVFVSCEDAAYLQYARKTCRRWPYRAFQRFIHKILKK